MLAEGFSMLRITEKIARNVNFSTENFRGQFTSMSIVNEFYCYNLLLEQQLVAEMIFVWYCCGNKMSAGVQKKKQQTLENEGETKWEKPRKRKRQGMRCWKKMTGGIQNERKDREKRSDWIVLVHVLFPYLAFEALILLNSPQMLWGFCPARSYKK